jgi:hypothetical protein
MQLHRNPRSSYDVNFYLQERPGICLQLDTACVTLTHDYENII